MLYPTNQNVAHHQALRHPKRPSALEKAMESQDLEKLTELFVKARQDKELKQAIGEHAEKLWSPPTDTDVNLIDYFDRLKEHSSPPESLDWYFKHFGERLELKGMNIGGARVTLRALIGKRPDLADQAADRLLQPHPEKGFSPAQCVGLEDLLAHWSPTPGQMARITTRLEQNLQQGPATSGPHARENQYLTTLLGHIKKAYPEAIDKNLGRTLLTKLLEDPERRLYTVYGLEPPNEGFKSQPTYQLAFPDPTLEKELLDQLEPGLEGCHDILMVLAGSMDYTQGAARLAERLKTDLAQRHEPEYVDRILDHVVLRWLDKAPETPDEAVEQRTALKNRWQVMQGRVAPLNPHLPKHNLSLEPDFITEDEPRIVLAHEASKRQPELMEALLQSPFLDRQPPDWPPARKAYDELSKARFERDLPEDYATLLRQFRDQGKKLGTDTWAEIAKTRFPKELEVLQPLMDGLPLTHQANLLEKLADHTGQIEDLQSLADLKPEQRPAAVVQVLDAPVPSSYFRCLALAAPDETSLSLVAHDDLCRRVEAGLDPETAFQQVTAPLQLGMRSTEPGAIGMHEGYIVVGGHRLRPRVET